MAETGQGGMEDVVLDCHLRVDNITLNCTRISSWQVLGTPCCADIVTVSAQYVDVFAIVYACLLMNV